MVNTPLPHSLKSEAKKAAKILREFSIPNAKSGPDSLIPAGILAKAKGLAIITVFKAGFLVTARGGSGIVVAKLDDGEFSLGTEWSAPSAIGMAGLGGGFEIGMEVTDFVIILNTKSAVEAFSKGGNLTLGGNFTIAAGPLGRNIEGDIAVRSTAAIYTYSKTKGIFAGISVEGSALIERKDANRKFYGRDIRASQILNGDVDRPAECQDLYDVLKEQQEFAVQAVADLAKRQAVKQKEKLAGMSEYSQYKFTRPASNSIKRPSEDKIPRTHSDLNVSGSSSPSTRIKGSSTVSNISARSTQAKESSQHQETVPKNDPWKDIDDLALRRTTASPSKYSGATANPSSYSGATANPSSYSGATANPSSYTRSATSSPNDFPRKASQETLWAIADFTYQAQLRCDLSFFAGDRIKVTTRTRSQQDWWEGMDSAGHQGIFPANYVHIRA